MKTRQKNPYTKPNNTNDQIQKSAAQQKEPRPLWKLILGIR